MRLNSFNKASRPPSIRLVKQDGKFHIEGFGAWYSYFRDPYHLMLVIPWPGFLGVVAVSYVIINALFALLYLLGGDCLTNARPGSFEDAFFFSVHTFGSIGYGVIAPKTTYANIIVTLEAISSLLSIAVVTGLTFARFSKPTARVIFSKFAVITQHNGIPTLMFRVGNKRRNQILEARINLYLLRDDITAEGDYFYRIYDLNLLRSQSPSFTLTWTAMHAIDENSPLYGYTPESLAKSHTQIIISLSGIDETASYTVNLRHVYGASDVLFDYKLMDIIYKSPNGDRYLDYANFHKAVPVAKSIKSNSEEVNRSLGLG